MAVDDNLLPELVGLFPGKGYILRFRLRQGEANQK
jgi:hypothetical protein